MKKKIMAVIMAAAMTFSMTACGGSSSDTAPGTEASTEAAADTAQETEAAGDTAQESEDAGDAAEATAEITTVTPGKLTVATSPDFAPYEFYAVGEDGTPTLAGFDIALAQYIADYLGLELEVVPVDFDGVLMELQTKAVDLGVAGLSPDPKRESIMDFSDIYYEGGQSFVCTQANKDKFTSLEDTNNAEYEIGAQTGAIQVDLAQANSPDADIIQLTKVTDIVAELIAGKLDGAYIETAVAESYAKNYPELCVVLDVPYDGAEGSAIGVSKGNDALKAGVNEAIAKAISEGKMDEFVATANEQASGEIIEGLLDQ
ncbi:transporter substrate-binding domain-containing protein [Butyrivibrio sp. AE3006]|uniref:transporter substrate-binding domain-containing protein n=1 Tax=Butyrivibrio sp. AE3006 TaxID=1280673 RepID=UPI00040EBC33|nr:transporter substrate-binding domain-containing protein [Butyrivibrio sp. AE3006]